MSLYQASRRYRDLANLCRKIRATPRQALPLRAANLAALELSFRGYVRGLRGNLTSDLFTGSNVEAVKVDPSLQPNSRIRALALCHRIHTTLDQLTANLESNDEVIGDQVIDRLEGLFREVEGVYWKAYAQEGATQAPSKAGVFQ